MPINRDLRPYRIETIWLKIDPNNFEAFWSAPGNGNQFDLSFDQWGYVNTTENDTFTPFTYNLAHTGYDNGPHTFVSSVRCNKPGIYAVSLGVFWNFIGTPVNFEAAQYITDNYGADNWRYGYKAYRNGPHTSSITVAGYPGVDDGFPATPRFHFFVTQESGSSQEIDDYWAIINYFGAEGFVPLAAGMTPIHFNPSHHTMSRRITRT